MAANPNLPAKIGKYDVVDVLGRGGMGIVYKAIDPHLDRLVAIKMVTSGFGDRADHIKRFFREAQSLGSLQHPNIVTVYELGDYSGNPYLVMQFLEGEPLDSVLLNRRPMSLLEKVSILLQVCHGLSYAHQRGVVHRDIKPANIMLHKDGGVKIFDFGIAFMGDRSVTTTGQIIGTLSYMSPEQVNAKPIDFRSDLFSAGVVLYQLATGHLPFEGETTAVTLLKILHDPPPPLEKFLVKYPPELEHMLQRCLAKDPEDRYSSAEQFGLDLGRLHAQLKQELIGQDMQEVTLLLQNGEVNRAQEVLFRVLKVDRQNTDANRMLRDLQQRSQKEDIGGRVRKLEQEARLAVSEEQFDVATSCVERALVLDRDNKELQSLLEWVEAEALRAEKVHRSLRLAESAHMEGRLETALRAVEGALELAPKDKQAKALHRLIQKEREERQRHEQLGGYVREAREEISSKRFTAALEILRKAEEIDPKAPEVHALIESAKTGKEQEQRRLEVEKLINEVETALNHDDYSGAYRKAEESLLRFPEERTLLKLRDIAQRQQQTAERRLFVEEQLAGAKKLLQENRNQEVLDLLQSALEKTGPDTRLQSLAAIVRETVDRERFEKRKSECLQRAKQLLRDQTPGDAVSLLEGLAAEAPGDVEIQDLLERAFSEKSSLVRNAIWRASQESVLDLRLQILAEALQKIPQDSELQKQLGGVEDLDQLVDSTAANATTLEQAGKYEEALAKWEALRSAYRHYPAIDHNIERVKQLRDQAANAEQSQWEDKIRRALDEGDFAAARDLAVQAEERFAWDPEIMGLHQEAESGLKQQAKSLKILAEAQRFFSDQQWEKGAEAARKAAKSASGDRVIRERALTQLKQALAAALDKDWRAADKIAECLNQIDPSLATSSEVQDKIQLKRREDLIASAIESAKHFEGEGDAEAALRELAAALASYPDDPQLLNFAIQLEEQTKKLQENVRLARERREKEAYVQGALARAQKEFNLDSRVHVLKESLRRCREEKRLLQQLEVSENLASRIHYLVTEANALEEARHYRQAIDKWDVIRSLHPDHQGIERAIQQLRSDQKNFEAEARMRCATNAKQYVDAGKYEEAAASLQKGLVELPGDVELDRLRQDLAGKLERRAKAAKELSIASKCVGKKQWKKAARSFDAAWHLAQLDPVIRDQVFSGFIQAATGAMDTDLEEADMLSRGAAAIQPSATQVTDLKAAIDDRRKLKKSEPSQQGPARTGFFGYFQDAFRSTTSEGLTLAPPAIKPTIDQGFVRRWSEPSSIHMPPPNGAPESSNEQNTSELTAAFPNPSRSADPLQTENGNSGSVAAAFRPDDGSVTPELLATRLERQLAQYIGPMARIAVKRASAQTQDPDALYEILARSLNEEDRGRFLAGRERHDGEGPATSGQRAAVTDLMQGPENTTLAPDITPAAIERAASLLAAYVGPISTVLAKKAARRSDSLATMYRFLALQVSDPSGRRQFLRDGGFPDGGR